MHSPQELQLTLAQTLFDELAKELAQTPTLVGNLHALYCVQVTRKSVGRGEWFLLCRGQHAPPLISKTQPKNADTKGLPVVVIEVDQRDLFNFFSGGLNAYKAITTGKVRIAGDLLVAQKLEEVFRKAGGVEKTMQYLKQHSTRLLESKL